MKKIAKYLTFSFFIICSLITNGQTESSTRKFVIKTDLLLPAAGLLNNSKITGDDRPILGLSIEYYHKQKSSINLTGNYFYNNKDYSKRKTIQIIPSYRVYLGDNLNKGFFTGGYLKYSTLSYKDYTAVHELLLDFKNESLSLGGLVGFHLTKSRFKFELLAGLGFGKVLNTKTYKNEVYYYENKTVKLDGILSLNIGYKI